MKRPIILLLMLLGFLSESLSQTHVYLGGGISSSKMILCCGGELQDRMWSYNLSLLAKSRLSQKLAISLGVIYNIKQFQSPFYSEDLIHNPLVEHKFSRYAIPLRLHWAAFPNINLNTGLLLNSFYLEELNFAFGPEQFKHNSPDFSFTCGVGGEWKHFLLDVLFGRSLSESELSFRNQYWTIDFNVYYRILSSAKE